MAFFLGCLALLAIAAFVAIVWSPLYIVALVVLLSLGAGAWFVVRQWIAVREFRRAWQPRGKDLLIVYSDSPHWKAYVEEHWLPRWGGRAVVLNWSERSTWRVRGQPTPEVRLFEQFTGEKEFNPVAILVPRRGRAVRIVPFWRAFRDFKHGRPRKLQKAEADLEHWLAEEDARNAK